MLEIARKNPHLFNVVTIVIPIATGAIGVLVAILDLWINQPATTALPSINSSTIEDLIIELEERKNLLQYEIENLDKLLLELTSEKPHSESPGDEKDSTLVTGFKTVAVYLVLTIATTLTVWLIIFDVILVLFSDYDWLITTWIWDFAWDDITLTWYWSRAETPGVIIGFILIALTALPGLLAEQSSEESGRSPAPKAKKGRPPSDSS